MRPHRLQPTRLLRPWDSPGKNTGVGCHFLLQCMKVKIESEVTQSCPTLSDPMDCSPPGSSIHGVFQARVLERGAIAFSETRLDTIFVHSLFFLTYRTSSLIGAIRSQDKIHNHSGFFAIWNSHIMQLQTMSYKWKSIGLVGRTSRQTIVFPIKRRGGRGGERGERGRGERGTG